MIIHINIFNLLPRHLSLSRFTLEINCLFTFCLGEKMQYSKALAFFFEVGMFLQQFFLDRRISMGGEIPGTWLPPQESTEYCKKTIRNLYF